MLLPQSCALESYLTEELEHCRRHPFSAAELEGIPLPEGDRPTTTHAPNLDFGASSKSIPAEKREVDFLVTWNKVPWMLVDCQVSGESDTLALEQFAFSYYSPMPHPRALLPILILALSASPGLAQWQRLDLFQYTLPLHMARALPVAGPEAAPANPARLSEAEHWYSQLGTAAAGRVSMSHTSAGVALPGGLSLGLAGLAVSGRAAGTNAVFLEQRAGLQGAYKIPGLAPDASLSLGYALAWHGVNGWSRYKASDFTHDLGLVWRPAPMGRGWRADLGLTLRDLVPVDADIPDTTGYTERNRLYSPMADAIARLTSPSGLYSAWISGVAGPGIDFDEYYGPSRSPGPGMGGRDFELHFHRYGVELRPIKVLALRVEQLGYLVWQAGATVGAGSLLPWRLEADFALSKGAYYTYTSPSGEGYTFAWALRGGW